MATPRIFAKNIEASAQTQIHDLAHSEAYSHCDMAIMPEFTLALDAPSER